MEMLLAGLIIGLVMGLTGSGGALIAIPLFMHFQNMTLIEASSFSLIAVVLSASFNFFPQRKEADSKLAVSLIPFSIAGSFLAVPIKSGISPSVVGILLAIIALYSLYSVWKPTAPHVSSTHVSKQGQIALVIIIGLTLGVLTTLTGLGGGVLLMPIFISIFKFSQHKAVATSLVVVAISSVFSILFQIQKGLIPVIDIQVVLLALGILITAIALQLSTKLISKTVLHKMRQIVFTLVVFVAMSKIAGELL
jgi:uncharacterized membrane protein YfcA